MANSRKVMLVCGDSKKVTSLPAPTGHCPDILLVIDVAKNLFFDGEREGKLLVQYYDGEFEDWVDIDDDFVAKDKQKLKIVLQGPALSSNLLGATDSAVEPTIDTRTDSEVISSETPSPLESTRINSWTSNTTISVDKDSSTVVVTPEAVSSASGSRIKRDFAAKRSVEPPLPLPFSLPANYTPMVMAGLQAGSLSGKMLTKFIGEIASAIFCFKSYPTREEKLHVAMQCIKKYPFLESRCGSGFGYIVIGLEERLKYLRKPRGTPSKRSCDEECPQPPAKKPPKPVKPTVLPIVHGVGEDEDSNRRNVKMLQSLYKLANPDPKSVEDLMTRTFMFRRSMLENTEDFTIGSFLDTYPFLRQEVELITEFNRVVEPQNASFLTVKLRWLEYVPRILQVGEKEGNHSITQWLQQRRDTSDEGSDSLLAAIVVSYMLHDPRTKKDHSRVVRLITANSDIAAEAAACTSSQPLLLASGCFQEGIEAIHLVMEKKVLITIRKKTDAIPLLFLTYFVFNLSYETGAQSFYHFLEHIFLKTKLGRKQGPQKLVTLLGL